MDEEKYMTLNDFELGWLTGIVEGEGSFGFTGPYETPCIRVGMTDKDIIERAARLLGVKVYKEERHSSRKTVWLIRISDQLKIVYLLTAMIPGLGERRSRSAKNLLKRSIELVEKSADMKQKRILARAIYATGKFTFLSLTKKTGIPKNSIANMLRHRPI